MNLQLVAGPVTEPLSLEQAKGFLNLDLGFTLDDLLVAGFVSAARVYAEGYTHRAFFNQQWRLGLNNFPVWFPDAGSVSPVSRGEFLTGIYWMRQSAILLPNPACVSVDSISYVNTLGVSQTLAASSYYVDTTAEPALLVPGPGTYWPTVQSMLPGAVQVTYTAGSYGDGVAVNTLPATITLAMQMLVAHWYANREAAGAAGKAIPYGVDALLDQYTIHCCEYNSHS